MSSLDCSKVKCTALNPITVLSNPCCKNAAHKRGQKTPNRKTVLEEGGPKLVKRIGEISGGVQKHVEEQGKQVEKNLLFLRSLQDSLAAKFSQKKHNRQ